MRENLYFELCGASMSDNELIKSTKRITQTSISRKKYSRIEIDVYY